MNRKLRTLAAIAIGTLILMAAAADAGADPGVAQAEAQARSAAFSAHPGR